MKFFAINQQAVLVVVILLLAVGSMLPTDSADFISRRVAGPVDFLINPFTRQLRKLSTHLRPARDPQRAGFDQTKQQLADNYDALRREYDLVQQQLKDARLLIERDFPELKIATRHFDLQLESYWQRRYRVARSYSYQLIISRGRGSGLSENLAVVYRSDLVGQLKNMKAASATVRLITTPGTVLHVRVVSPNPDSSQKEDRTVIQLTADDSGDAFWSDPFAREADVNVGDLALLSDHRQSLPRAARSFCVGTVEKIEPDDTDPTNFRRVKVVPRSSLLDLDYVIVLVPMQTQ